MVFQPLTTCLLKKDDIDNNMTICQRKEIIFFNYLALKKLKSLECAIGRSGSHQTQSTFL